MIPRFSPVVTAREIVLFQRDVLCKASVQEEGLREFEQRFADYLGAEDALFVSSGRMALWLILEAMNYPPGSEIVLPAFTFFAIPAVIQLAGYTPVYADISPDTYELTAPSVAAVLSKRTRAIIPTHLFGRTCDMAAMHGLCEGRGIDIIEDCAQSMGAAHGNGKAGESGTAAYYTFGITKNFTTFGGGMVLCRDRSVREKIRSIVADFRDPGRRRLLKRSLTAMAMFWATRRSLFSTFLAPMLTTGRGRHPDLVQRLFAETVGPLTQAQLDPLRWRPTRAQAQAGLRQLDTLDAKNATRREKGHELLAKLSAAGCRGLPAPAGAGGDHIYVSFAIRRDNPCRFGDLLRRRGVDTSLGYMSDCSGIRELGGGAGACPNAGKVASRILHLPLYPGLISRDLQRIADAVASVDERDQNLA